MSKNTCQLFYRSLFGLTVFFIFSTLMSCNKSDVEYGEAPLIELIQISLDTVREFKDVEILTIRYYDGNGDIGFPDPQDYAVFVRDTRLDNFDGFYIGPIAPLDANVPVTGEINIEFPNLFIFGNRNTEKTQFEIKVVDRAGNESNLLTTDPVVIIK